MLYSLANNFIKYQYTLFLPLIFLLVKKSCTSDGFDEGIDDKLRERYFDKVSLTVAYGSKYYFVMRSKEVEDAGNAKSIPMWSGAVDAVYPVVRIK